MPAATTLEPNALAAVWVQDTVMPSRSVTAKWVVPWSSRDAVGGAAGAQSTRRPGRGSWRHGSPSARKASSSHGGAAVAPRSGAGAPERIRSATSSA